MSSSLRFRGVPSGRPVVAPRNWKEISSSSRPASRYWPTAPHCVPFQATDGYRLHAWCGLTRVGQIFAG